MSRKVLETVNELPVEFELDELIERLLVIEKVEEELRQLDKGQTKMGDEVKQLANAWRM